MLTWNKMSAPRVTPSDIKVVLGLGYFARGVRRLRVLRGCI